MISKCLVRGVRGNWTVPKVGGPSKVDGSSESLEVTLTLIENLIPFSGVTLRLIKRFSYRPVSFLWTVHIMRHNFLVCRFGLFDFNPGPSTFWVLDNFLSTWKEYVSGWMSHPTYIISPPSQAK